MTLYTCMSKYSPEVQHIFSHQADWNFLKDQSPGRFSRAMFIDEGSGVYEVKKAELIEMFQFLWLEKQILFSSRPLWQVLQWLLPLKSNQTLYSKRHNKAWKTEQNNPNILYKKHFPMDSISFLTSWQHFSWCFLKLFHLITILLPCLVLCSLIVLFKGLEEEPILKINTGILTHWYLCVDVFIKWQVECVLGD